MALFDSVIGEASEKFDLGDKAGTMLASLVALITNQETGGFSGFLSRFKEAGLGDMATSWVTSGDNVEISNEQLESALGEDTIGVIAEQTGVDQEKATSALAFMTPKVVDQLTPEGDVPDEESLTSSVSGFLNSVGAATAGAVGTAGALASDAAETVGDTAAAVGDKIGGALDSVGGSVGVDNLGDDGGNILRWLLPVILLGIIIALGFMFCNNGRNVVGPAEKDDQKTEKDLSKTGDATDSDAGAKTGAEAEKPATEAGAADDADPAGDADTTADGERELTKVTLSDGTEIQAYPGGIEDQLVKYIESDEYKNATAEDLKTKWFNFDDLNFEFNSTELTAESQRQLENIVAILKANPDVKIKIGGYTDKKGNDANNKALSDRRAKAVQAALEKAGVGDQVPEAEGFGEEFAEVDENASDEERAADRKTAIRLIK